MNLNCENWVFFVLKVLVYFVRDGCYIKRVIPFIYHTLHDNIDVISNFTMTEETTKILVVGGSFGGLSFLKQFINLVEKGDVTDKKIQVDLIEPRAGLLNVLGIPRAVIDDVYAKESYFNTENMNIKFTSVTSSYQDTLDRWASAKQTEELPQNLTVNYIQGKVTSFIDDHNVNYQVGDEQDIKRLQFDYCVYAAGRRRRWPFDPKAITEEGFVKEMQKSKKEIEDSNIITVIGGGALGIEIAGEFKEYYGDSKRIRLVHPHPFVPPEIFASKNFKQKLREELEASGVELCFNTRIETELENGDLVTTDGRTLESDLNLWCNYHKNNIEPLLPVFESSIELPKGEVSVDTRLLMKGHENIFAIGDVISLKIIKTCGGAYRQGLYVGESLYNIIVKGEKKYVELDLDTWPHGMTIVVGTQRIISQWDDIGDGKVVYNSDALLEMYSDYCTKSSKTLYNVK